MSSRRIRNLAAAFSLACVTTAVTYAETLEPEDSIVARRAVMRVISLNFAPLVAMAKEEIPFDAQTFRTNAERMALVSSMPVADYFVDGTDVDVGEAKTEALPEIWLDWENFSDKLETMRREVADLSVIAQSGDADALKNQVIETADACKDCHDAFRR
ncbi:MAG: cytochrome c [Gammaproteobacteria bacterium]|nr:cytochrome c [Gammaproteobacteria bacterium]